MRRKNFIIILLFIFINILSFSNENLPTVNTSINSMNPTYDESLKEYKIKSENTDLFYNYIKKIYKWEKYIWNYRFNGRFKYFIRKNFRQCRNL